MHRAFEVDFGAGGSTKGIEGGPVESETLTWDERVRPWLQRVGWTLIPAIVGVVVAAIVAFPSAGPRYPSPPILDCVDPATQAEVPYCRQRLDALEQRASTTHGRRALGVEHGVTREELRHVLGEEAADRKLEHERHLAEHELQVALDELHLSVSWLPLLAGGLLSFGLWGWRRRRRRDRLKNLVISAHSLGVNGEALAIAELVRVDLAPADGHDRVLHLQHVDGRVLELAVAAHAPETGRLEAWLQDGLPDDAAREEERRAKAAVTREARRLRQRREI